MNWNYLLLLFMASFLVVGCSDDDDEGEGPTTELTCGEDIFVDGTAENVLVQRGIKYGENAPLNGETTDLLMDVFYPENINGNLPAIVWAFGGSFVSGDRTQLEQYARQFAQKGYVCATIDYRLLPIAEIGIPDSLDFVDAVAKAVSDMKASIREINRLSATSSTFPTVDQDLIFAAGVSAGSITAIHAAYVQDSDPLPDYVRDAFVANGGFEGNSGVGDNNDYSSEIAGVINLSGSIGRVDWIDSNDPPIYSYHGDMDETVPYGSDIVNSLGFDIIYAQGSLPITQRCTELGITNQLQTVEGGGHSDIYTGQYMAELDELDDNLTDFLIPIVCQ